MHLRRADANTVHPKACKHVTAEGCRCSLEPGLIHGASYNSSTLDTVPSTPLQQRPRNHNTGPCPMSTDWNEGCFTDVGYTYGYYREISPVFQRFCLLLNGFASPASGADANHCELGFGLLHYLWEIGEILYHAFQNIGSLIGIV